MNFVVSWNFRTKLVHELREIAELLAREFRVLIRHRQMCRNAMNLQVGQCRHLPENMQRFGGQYSHPSHACVYYKADCRRRRARDLAERLSLRKTGDGGDESTLRDRRPLVWQSRAEDDNRM